VNLHSAIQSAPYARYERLLAQLRKRTQGIGNVQE
jgi:hypothetical protein